MGKRKEKISHKMIHNLKMIDFLIKMGLATCSVDEKTGEVIIRML